MVAFVAIVLSFVASTLAYQVTFPNAQNGWTSTGPQIVEWERVDTDPETAAIQLTDQFLAGKGLFQKELLLAQVDGTLGRATVYAPSNGWTPDNNYRVNLVQSAENDNAILAQSGIFAIANNGSSTSNSASGSAAIVIATSATTPTTGTTGTSGSSATDSANILPTSSSAAALSYPVQTGLLGLFSLLGFALA